MGQRCLTVGPLVPEQPCRHGVAMSRLFPQKNHITNPTVRGTSDCGAGEKINIQETKVFEEQQYQIPWKFVRLLSGYFKALDTER